MCIPTEAIASTSNYKAFMKYFYSSALTKYKLDNTKHYRIKMRFQISKAGEMIFFFLHSDFGEHS